MKKFRIIYTVISTVAVIEDVIVEDEEDPLEKFFTELNSHVSDYNPTEATSKLKPMELATKKRSIEEFEEGRVKVYREIDNEIVKLVLIETT